MGCRLKALSLLIIIMIIQVGIVTLLNFILELRSMEVVSKVKGLTMLLMMGTLSRLERILMLSELKSSWGEETMGTIVLPISAELIC